MDAKELCNLQEAYLKVYQQVDEAKVDKKLPEWKRSAARTERYGNPHGSVGSGPQRDRRAEHEERRGVPTKVKEQVDIYNIILSHLLDEGYAETPESAEAIMANMSEGWKRNAVKSAVKRGAYGAGYVAGKTVRVASSAAKKFERTPLGQRVKRFVNYTALGALANPMLS